MNDFQKPVGPKPPNPYEKIEPINSGENKEEKEKKDTSEKIEKKGIFALAVLSCIKKITKFFSLQERKITVSYNLPNACKLFKEQLKKLEKENLSEDEEFSKDLSTYWRQLKEAYEFDFLKHGKSDDNIEKLISEINNYYGDQEYPLGYYLVNYKKTGWHPFPFINILKLLHKEHYEIKSARVFQLEIPTEKLSESKKLSALENWIALLDKIE